MSLLETDSFPRGGQNKIIRTQYKRKHADEPDLFGGVRNQAPKQDSAKKVDKKKATGEEVWQIPLKLHGTLSYNKIHEGMLILGCIRQISNLSLQIEFPGLTFAIVTINEISDEFTERLSHHLKENNLKLDEVSLDDIVKVGQVLPAKVTNVTKTDKGHDVQATINPKSINSDKNHYSFKKGLTIWASVKSKLDHGYELSVGVRNCRVFLPFKNIPEEREYAVGEPLYCIIHKVENSNTATTLTVSAKLEHIGQSRFDDFAIDDLVPGMKVELIIEEVSPNGIKGIFLENSFGYIDRSHFPHDINLQKFKVGKAITAYILYTEPMTKVTYLTLHGLDSTREPTLKSGKITSAKVTSTAPNGVYLNLGDNNVGFVTNKRLLASLTNQAQMNVVDGVRKKYPIGSSHTCRILDYNFMSDLYICTFEKSLLKEKIFNVNNLTIGELVQVQIDRIVEKGIVVKAGHIQGFVPNLHLSNSQYSDTFKAKFSVGMTVDARILDINTDNNVIFTLKPGLVESDVCLTKMEGACTEQQYPGFVVQAKSSGVLIAFYGNIKGWMSNKVLNWGNSGRHTDPREYFFIGQVVNVFVVGQKNGKLLLSLTIPKPASTIPQKKNKIPVGAIVDGIVKAVHPDRIEVEIGEDGIQGSIPLAHLSSNMTLGEMIQKILQPGQKLEKLRCIRNSGDCPLMSRRKSKVDQKQSLTSISDNLSDIIEETEYIVDLHRSRNSKATEYKIGSRVKSKIKHVDESGVIVDFPNGTEGRMPLHLKPAKCTVGSMIECVVLDYNLAENFVLLSGNSAINSKINKVQDGFIKTSFQSSCNAKILLNTKLYTLGVLTGGLCNRQLVYLPLSEGNASVSKRKTKVVLYKRLGNKILALPKRLVPHMKKNSKQEKNPESIISPSQVVSNNGTNNNNTGDEESDQDSETCIEDDVENTDEACEKISNGISNGDEQLKESDDSHNDNNETVLSGTQSFYDVKEPDNVDSSSDDDEESQPVNKKKKLSPAERAEAAKIEEERMQRIEKQLADNTAVPQSADQFDRLLLANPNSSKLWLQYMSMHLATAELEKARAVGRKALETINMIFIKEKFNVWIALLNLENMYGTKESFETLFEEATRFNDFFDIYSGVIKMLAASEKFSEMEEKIRKLKMKEKQNTKMWLELGQLYFSLGKFREARNMREAALKSITDKKRQFDLIVRFGIMEFQLGEIEQAVANFETILNTYPSKISIWMIYVDQLTKRGKIELARQVLERAVRQKFGIKAMKSLFQKFISFEEQNGSAEAVEKVKNEAKEYVAKLDV